MLQHGIDYIYISEDYTSEVLSLGKPAGRMLWNLIRERGFYTNESGYKVAGTTTAKCELTRAYNELKKKNLVKRIRNQRYMVNPEAILPDEKRYDRVLEHWHSL